MNWQSDPRNKTILSASRSRCDVILDVADYIADEWVMDEMTRAAIRISAALSSTHKIERMLRKLGIRIYEERGVFYAVEQS